MSFKANLFALIDAASSFSVGGYKVKTFSYESTRRLDPRDSMRYVKIDLEADWEGSSRFFDQVVDVSPEGDCEAVCSEGDSHVFEFSVSRPITEGDLK